MRGSLFAMLLLAVPLNASAAVWEYNTPTPEDVFDLSHYSIYQWQISVDDYGGLERLWDATLTFRSIWDWLPDEEDQLYLTLLDSPYTFGGGWMAMSSNIWCRRDYEGDGDYFADKFEAYPTNLDWRKPWGISIGVWSDPRGGHDGRYASDVTFSFKDLGLMDELQAFCANDGKFVIGLDPDCTYQNLGVEFAMLIQREGDAPPTPELSTWLLLGCSVLAGWVLRSRRPTKFSQEV